MAAAPLHPMNAASTNSVSAFPQPVPKVQITRELAIFGVLVVALNGSLLFGKWNAAFAFHPLVFSDGQWWRALAFPFVHVSIYHLVLDFAAFVLLYSGLRERPLVRVAYVFSSAWGGLLAALVAAPAIQQVGLCGLSGVAHGLMAIMGLDFIRNTMDQRKRLVGWLLFGSVATKAAIEAATGMVVFTNLHAGNLGTPIAVCHAGGILGALFLWVMHAWLNRRKRGTTTKET